MKKSQIYGKLTNSEIDKEFIEIRKELQSIRTEWNRGEIDLIDLRANRLVDIQNKISDFTDKLSGR
jgi:hypothetical protein